MEESILKTVRKVMNVSSSEIVTDKPLVVDYDETDGVNDVDGLIETTTSYDTAFDEELLLAINSAFFTLHQLGVGPYEVFSISDESAVWSDFDLNISDLLMVKEYVCLKVRLSFDPPVSSTLHQSIKDQIAEYEWRLSVAFDKS